MDPFDVGVRPNTRRLGHSGTSRTKRFGGILKAFRLIRRLKHLPPLASPSVPLLSSPLLSSSPLSLAASALSPSLVDPWQGLVDLEVLLRSFNATRHPQACTNAPS